MVTAPKSPISHHNSLAECRGESELLRRKTQAQVLSMRKLIEQSNAAILDCKTVLIKLRSDREIERGKFRF